MNQIYQEIPTGIFDNRPTFVLSYLHPAMNHRAIVTNAPSWGIRSRKWRPKFSSPLAGRIPNYLLPPCGGGIPNYLLPPCGGGLRWGVSESFPNKFRMVSITGSISFKTWLSQNLRIKNPCFGTTNIIHRLVGAAL